MIQNASYRLSQHLPSPGLACSRCHAPAPLFLTGMATDMAYYKVIVGARTFLSLCLIMIIV